MWIIQRGATTAIAFDCVAAIVEQRVAGYCGPTVIFALSLQCIPCYLLMRRFMQITRFGDVRDTFYFNNRHAQFTELEKVQNSRRNYN